MIALPPLTSVPSEDAPSRGFAFRMNSSIPRWTGLALTCALILLFSKECIAQVVDPVTMAQAPVPGVGHHYIGMGTETVNPADGSVSFDLPIQTPPGRGLCFPFGIHYSEAEPFYISGAGGYGTTFGWTSPGTRFAQNKAPFPDNELGGSSAVAGMSRFNLSEIPPVYTP